MSAPPIPQHPVLQRPELVLHQRVSFKHPKTGEALSGTVVGTDYRPVAGGQDGVYLVVQLPPKKDPYTPGEVVKPLFSDCTILKA